MKGLLREFDAGELSATVVYEDNQGTIFWGEKGVRNAKHVFIHKSYVKEEVREGAVQHEYLPPEKMKADILTKLLLRVRLELLRTSIGVVNVTTGAENKKGT